MHIRNRRLKLHAISSLAWSRSHNGRHPLVVPRWASARCLISIHYRLCHPHAMRACQVILWQIEKLVALFSVFTDRSSGLWTLLHPLERVHTFAFMSVSRLNQWLHEHCISVWWRVSLDVLFISKTVNLEVLYTILDNKWSTIHDHGKLVIQIIKK